MLLLVSFGLQVNGACQQHTDSKLSAARFSGTVHLALYMM